MTAALRAGLLVFGAALVQVSAVGDLAGVTPDVVLVAVVLLAWNRGAMAGAWAGFAGGLLVDTMTLGRLGASSLLLLLAGYWAGRYAETTGRGRSYAPYLAVLVLSVAAWLGAHALTALFGDPVDVGRMLGPLLPAALLNTVLALLLYRPVRWLLGRSDRQPPSQEVEVIG